MARFVDFSDDFLRGIGEVVVAFARVELSLQLFLSGLIGAGQPTGQAVASSMSTRGIRELLPALYSLRVKGRRLPAEDAAALRAVLRRCAKCEDRRNDLLHSIWAPSGPASAATRMKTTAKSKRGLTTASELVDVDQLQRDAAEMYEVASALNLLWVHLATKGVLTPQFHHPFDMVDASA